MIAKCKVCKKKVVLNETQQGHRCTVCGAEHINRSGK